MPVCSCAGEAHCSRVPHCDPGLAHKCMNCGGVAHSAFCCIEWSEHGSHGIYVSYAHAKAKANTNPLVPKAMVQHLNSSSNNREDLCLKCLEDLKKILDAIRKKAPAAHHNISVRRVTTIASSVPAKAADIEAAAAPLTSFITTSKKSKEGGPATRTKEKKISKHF